MDYPVLASSSTLDIAAPVDLWAGSMPIHTNRAVVSGATAIRQYEVVMREADGTITPYAAANEDAVVVGVAAVAIPAGQSGPYYTGGYFNWEKLLATGVTTLAGLQALFGNNGSIQIGTILK